MRKTLEKKSLSALSMSSLCPLCLCFYLFAFILLLPSPIHAASVTVSAGAVSASRGDAVDIDKSNSMPDEVIVDKAIELFIKNFSDEYATDNAILCAWIAERHPHSGLEKYVDDAFLKLASNPDRFNPNFLRFAREDHPMQQPLCGNSEGKSDMNCLIIRGLWCDIEKENKALIRELEKITEKAVEIEEVDIESHALLILTELKKRNCADEDSAKKMERLELETAGFIAGWMDGKTEAYGEGVAFLLRAGLDAGVEERDVDLIRGSLNEKIRGGCSGCQSSEPHDTLLEIYALAQWDALKSGRRLAADARA